MKWLTIFCAFAAFAAAAPAGAEALGSPAILHAVRAEAGTPGTTRITIELDRRAPPRSFTLAGPDRFVVDLPNARLGGETAESGGVVHAIRRGARPEGAARLVFDLAGPAQVSPPTVESLPGGRVRLVYALRSAVPPPASRPAPDVVSRPQARIERAAVSAARPRDAGRRVIVIDAGHGGHDPGAQGAQGAREKVVVLAAALALRDALEARGGYHVVLTREGDRFLPLEDRVAVARDHKADLFISLHADSSPSAQAKGASVYTLSERGGERAKGVMEAQDWDMDLGPQPHSPRVEQILLDLAQRETTNRSAEFAQTLLGELSGQIPLLNRSHRNAGFFVLLAPDVPAVLLEMGFLTNPQDEARLTDPRARRLMMSSVADAIDVYFARPRDYAGP